MRALITGGFGFVGRHLAKHLTDCGDDVAVTYLPGTEDQRAVREGQMAGLPSSVQTIALDVTEKKMVVDVVSLLKPDAVFHLAAITFVPDGEFDQEAVFRVNTFGTLNLLDAIKRYSPETRFLSVGSAEMYGDPRAGSLPFTENSPLRPISTYGVSKVAADLLTYKYVVSEGLHAVRARPFPHIGPGQNESFAVSNFAKQIALIKLGRAEPRVKVGNLETRRDYADVSDIVRGYREALLNGISGEAYNLCCGQSYQMNELLQTLIRIANVEVELVVDEARIRSIDIPDLFGSYQKANKDFGWRPRVELEGTLTSVLGYWLELLH